MEEKKKIKRSLIIGLGGTGRDAVLFAKHKVLSIYDPENHKSVPPMLKFLVFDTTSPQTYKSGDKETKLDMNSEFIRLSVADAQSVIENQPHIKRAIPKENLSKAKHITDGAGQIRSLGRLAFLANYQEIKYKILNAIAEIRNWKVANNIDSEYDTSDSSLNVHIVFSTSGGTGGGLFLDIANLLRQQDAGLNASDKSIGYIVLPDIFDSKPFVANVRPNCYASFKELDFFMDAGSDGKYFFDYGTEKSFIKRNPFDNVLLINNTNREGTNFSEITDLAEFIGTGICVTTGSIGKDSNDMWDNGKGQVGESIQGKILHYSSFGISELFYDGEKLAKLCANEAASKIIYSYLNQTTLDINQETDIFIDNIHVREDRDQNEVLDALLSVSPKPVPSIDSLKNIAGRCEDTKTQYLLKVQNDTESYLRQSLEKLTYEKSQLLREKINKSLTEVNGIDFVQKFLNILNGKMGAFQVMMTEEIGDFSNRQKAVQSKYGSIKEDAGKAEKRFFGKEKAVNEAIDSFNALLKNEGIYIQEIKRRQYAENFFSFFINEIKVIEDEVAKIAGYLHKIQEDLTKRIQITRSSGREMKPFVIEISQDLIHSVDTGNIDVNDFLRHCTQINRPVYGWHELLISEIQSILLEYSQANSHANYYLNTTIEAEFKKLSIEKQKSIIQALDRKAVPLWQYDRGKILKTTEQYLIGVENDVNSLFSNNEQLIGLLKSNFAPKLSSTGDKFRITLYKLESSAPAHAVMNFKRYREAYRNKIDDFGRHPNTALDFHIIEGWKDTLPELFPISENENAILDFAIAISNSEILKLIKRDKGKYWIYIDKNIFLRTNGYDVLSESQAREQAFKDFADKSEYVDMIHQKIQEIREKYGDEKFKQEIENQIAFLQENSTSVTAKTMELISKEIASLNEYLKKAFNKL